jgi:hypothetical protein
MSFSFTSPGTLPGQRCMSSFFWENEGSDNIINKNMSVFFIAKFFKPQSSQSEESQSAQSEILCALGFLNFAIFAVNGFVLGYSTISASSNLVDCT